MRGVFLLLSVLFTATVFAQEAKIEVVGEIIDSDSREAIPYVHIVNKSTNSGTSSNTEGRFWIRINPSDTLLFSAIGFETYQFIINNQINTERILITIELSQSTLELEDVKVFAFKDENALKRAILDTQVPLKTEDNSLKIPGVYKKNWRAPEGGGVALGGPLTKLGNLFSKEQKELKKLKSVQKDFDAFQNTKAKYNVEVVMNITGLPEDKVEDFMKFCVLEDSYLLRATEYEIAVVVNQCLVDYNNQGDPK